MISYYRHGNDLSYVEKVKACRYAALTICIAFILSLTSYSAMAQDLEPRSYSNIPIGMNFLVVGYARSQGEVSPSPSAPVEDANLNINSAVLAYAHSFGLLSSSSKFDMSVARTCFTGSARLHGEVLEADRCGYTDPNFRLTWNFFGAPALKAKDFSQWKQGVVIGTSLQVTAPIGSYSEDKLLNAGANRWVFRPGIGMSQKLGNWYYNIIASVRLYGDNDEYVNGTTLAQAPQYTFQGHLIYSFGKGQWLSLNGNYFFGAETQKSDVYSDDHQDNSRFGVTYSVPIGQRHSIKLNYSKGVMTRVGNDFDSFGALWQYRF